jgi:hypothetical protein
MSRALTINVSPAERQALLEMSKQDIRAPYDQLRYLIVAEATRRGLLQPTKNDAGFVLADTGIAR